MFINYNNFMHFLCPLCDPEAYVEKIKTINTNFIN